MGQLAAANSAWAIVGVVVFVLHNKCNDNSASNQYQSGNRAILKL